MFRQGGSLIVKIHQLAGRIFTKKLKNYKVSQINAAQGRILFALWRNNGVPMQELARMTSLGKSTLTSMLDRLEESGYLTRIPCKEDKRKIRVFATHGNSNLMDTYEKVVGEMADIFYKGFENSEIDQFEIYLSRVYKNLLEHGDDK